MAHETRTVIGIFSDTQEADGAVKDLKDLGLDPKNMSIMVKDLKWSREAIKGKGTKIVEGAVAGAGTGIALGALTGLLVGLGTIAIPGIGALFIGGPVVAALGLTGAAATAVSAATSGALAGGLVGSLVGIGLPREVAEVYEERIKHGAVVLAVTTRSMEDEGDAREVFVNHRAEHIHVLGGPASSFSRSAGSMRA